MPELSGRRLALGGLIALVSFIAFESIAVATAMPEVARALSIDVSYSLAFSLFLTGMLAGQGGGGAWCDRDGPTGCLVTGAGTFTVGLVACGLAPGAAVLLLGRGLSGLGAGLVMVAMFVVVAEVFDETTRPRVFGYLSAAWVLPSLVGPVVAGWLATAVTWRAVFLGVAPLALIVVSLIVPVLRRQPARTHELSPAVRRRTGYSLLLAAAALVGPWALQPGSPASLRVVVLVVALGLTGWCLLRLLPPGTLRAGPGLPSVIGVRAFVAGCYFGAEAYLPLAVNTVRGMSLTNAGWALTAASIGWAFGSWVQGRDRSAGVGRVKWLLAGAALVTAGIAVLPTTMVPAVTPWAVIGIWALAATGMGLSMTTSNVVVMDLSEPAEQGRNGAALQVGESVGSITGVALAGAVHNALVLRYSPEITFSALWWALACCCLPAVLLAVRARSAR